MTNWCTTSLLLCLTFYLVEQTTQSAIPEVKDSISGFRTGLDEDDDDDDEGVIIKPPTEFSSCSEVWVGKVWFYFEVIIALNFGVKTLSN